MVFNFLILMPELFITLWLIILLIVYTILSQKTSSLTYKGKKYYPNIFNSLWVSLFFLSIFYFLILAIAPTPHFYTVYGLYSNGTVYGLRLVLSFLFIIYFLYLKVDRPLRTFYSFEFYIILFFSFLSLNLILISCTLLNLFIFIELFSLCTYFLLITNKRSPKTIEASIKYFVFGSTSSSLLLFGFFLLYLRTGAQDLFDISMLTYNNNFFAEDPYFLLAASLISLSFLLKIGASVFFFWMADVYEGANYPLLIYLNTFLKLVYIFKLFQFLNSFNSYYLLVFIKFLLILSFLFGFFGSLYQIKTKKFLIFLSIYNISFFSIVFWNFSYEFHNLFMLYALFYSLNSMLFTILFSSVKDWVHGLTIKNLFDLVNLKSQNPSLVFFFIFYSLVVSGLPPSILFLLKFSIFFEISRQLSFFWLFAFLLFSTLSFFVYVRLIRLLLKSDEAPTIFLKPIPKLISLLLALGAFLNIFCIFFFDKILLMQEFLL